MAVMSFIMGGFRTFLDIFQLNREVDYCVMLKIIIHGCAAVQQLCNAVMGEGWNHMAL